MKTKIIMAMTLSLLFINGIAQNPVKEIGLTFSNLSDFGLIYKAGTDKGLFRLSLLSLSVFSSDENLDQNFQGGAIGGGYEFRKGLGKNLSFVYGPDLQFAVSRTRYNDGASYNYTATIFRPNLGMILGFRYSVNERFSVSTELRPSIFYQYDHSNNRLSSDTNSSSYGFTMSNHAAAITIAYKIQ